MESWQVVGGFPLTQPCEEKGVGAPAAIVLNGKVHLFYQTYGNREKDAICHAVSDDGLRFEKDPTNPIFHPTDDWCCGRAYLFYLDSPDMGESWYISKVEIFSEKQSGGM